jgi:hypothetical protein
VENPQAFIDKCVRDSVEPSIGAVLQGGGRIYPVLFKLYQSEKYNYLCYNQNYYHICINHYPQLKKIAQDEIKQDADERIKQCFSSLKQDFEKKGFDFNEGILTWNVEIAPEKILIKIEKKIDVSKGERAEAYENFDTSIQTYLYELIMTAREIVNQEAQYCNFEYNGFIALYPEFDIKRISYDESKIYKVRHRNSKEEFKFAIRGCALPPGI